jgi:hypothetical protein
MVPWCAWVKRFHLPETEKLNGRATVGYLADLASGAELLEQQVCGLFSFQGVHARIFGPYVSIVDMMIAAQAPTDVPTHCWQIRPSVMVNLSRSNTLGPPSIRALEIVLGIRANA